MPTFPQLSTGSVTQYPCTRGRELRTVFNTSLDEHTVRLGDPDAEATVWRLFFTELSDAEWAALEALFHATEGALGEFTFLDPLGNLLSWSEKLTETVWQRDPLIQVTEQIADPLGGTRASQLTNTAQASQTLAQSIQAPADWHYSLSLFARSDVPVSLALKRFSASASAADSFPVGTSWQALRSSGNLGESEEPVSFGIELPVSATVEVYGIQVEPQPAASAYKKTEARGGVYRNARFLDDALTVMTRGPGLHSTVIRVVSSLKE